jgi:hypothetical protein
MAGDIIHDMTERKSYYDGYASCQSVLIRLLNIYSFKLFLVCELLHCIYHSLLAMVALCYIHPPLFQKSVKFQLI